MGSVQLADLAGDITGRPLDRARPLWEMWIVEGLAGGRIGFIAKMHHSTVDGVSGAALLSVLFDLAPEPALEALPPSSRSTPGALGTGAGQPGTGGPDAPTHRDDSRPVGRPRVLDVRRVRLDPENRAPRARAALPLSAPRTCSTARSPGAASVALTAIGLDDVKRLKKATGTTVNDVVLAVCTGALRTFLLEGDELPIQAPGGGRTGLGPDRRGGPGARTWCRPCSCSFPSRRTTHSSGYRPSTTEPSAPRRSTKRWDRTP